MQKINIKELLRYNKENKVRPLHFVLANRAQNKLGEIDNVVDVNFNPKFNAADELSFTVYKKINNTTCRLWNDIKNLKLVWVKEYKEWFQIQVNTDESENITKKIVTATALCEAELSQTLLRNLEINTESDIARKEYVNPTVFYNPNAKNCSLLDRVLEKVPNYTIKHVDDTLCKIQKTFSTDGTSVYDFLTGTISQEIGCIFIFNSNERGIYVYDLKYMCLSNNEDGTPCNYRTEEEIKVCPNCGGTAISKPYGFDTTIFIDKANLAQNLNLTVDADSIKNCFNVKGGDDMVNATLANVNPSGSSYYYYFNDETREDMGKELTDKLDSYDAMYNDLLNDMEYTIDSDFARRYNSIIDYIHGYYINSEYKSISDKFIGYPSLIKTYYDLIDVKTYLQSGMTPTWEQSEETAQSQLNLLTTSNLSPVAVLDVNKTLISSADNAVLAMAKAIVDTGMYKVEIVKNSSSYESQLWKGKFKLTSYSDEEDTAENTSEIQVMINDDVQTYAQQTLDRTIAKINKMEVTDIYGVEDTDTTNIPNFKEKLHEYCLSSLTIFQEAYKKALEALMQLKASETGHVLYQAFYVPYYNKSEAIEREINYRDNQVETIDEGLKIFETLRENVQNELDFEKYLGTDMWNTFISYRREDDYSNDNYVSDGLSNTELIDLCNELIEKAKDELKKSSDKQYSISGSLLNLLLITNENEEDKALTYSDNYLIFNNQKIYLPKKSVFEPLLEDFTLGNFIRCKIDNVIYKMRLIDVTIDYNDLSNLSVTFADVRKIGSSIGASLKETLAQAQSMSTQFTSVKDQASQGVKADMTLEKIRQEGLNSAQYNVFNTYSKTVIDDFGLLSRGYDDVNDVYSDEQMRINGTDLIFTTNNWKSTELAIGKQKYTLNGVTYEEYGSNTKFAISSKIIAGDIYSGNYKTDGDGNIVKGTHWDLTNGNFGIADGKMVYNSSTNELKMKGVTIDWNTTETPEISDISGLGEYLTQLDGRIQTYSQDTDPSLDWTTSTQKNEHIGDIWFNTYYSTTWRWEGTSWSQITDADLTELAQSKAQVFTTTPTTPYRIGDIWMQGIKGEIMTCKVNRLIGSFVESDWEKTNKYTDDSSLEDFITGDYADELEGISKSIDKKAETWYQTSDPSTSWTTDDIKEVHLDDLWYNSTTTVQKSYIYKKENGTYKWVEMKVSKEMFDMVDSKKTIYTSLPSAYNVNDVYILDTDRGNWKKGSILVAKNTRTNQTSFLSTDWDENVRYTDDTKVNDLIKKVNCGVDVEYALSTSLTVAPTSGWSTTAPSWTSGKYMWQRTATYSFSGTPTYTNATCIAGASGKDGVDGKPGANGVSTYFYVRYSTNSNGNPMTATPSSSSKYMGVCSTTDTTAPSNYTSYSWTLIKGADGTNGSPGAPGANGQTSYLHVKYSNDGKTFTGNSGEDLGSYIGTYVDFTQADSTTFSVYAWKKFVGEGIKSIVEQYYLSTSNSSCTGGSWSETQPTWSVNHYYWTRSKITWDDNSVTYTTPILANGINMANLRADEAKGVAENAKSVGNLLVKQLGFQKTEINEEYIISPVISGGSLFIGDPTGTYAQITTDGRIYGTGGNIAGFSFDGNGFFSETINGAVCSGAAGLQKYDCQTNSTQTNKVAFWAGKSGYQNGGQNAEFQIRYDGSGLIGGYIFDNDGLFNVELEGNNNCVGGCGMQKYRSTYNESSSNKIAFWAGKNGYGNGGQNAEFQIRHDGTVHITCDKNADYITMMSNDGTGWENYISPLQYKLENIGENIRSISQAGGLFFYKDDKYVTGIGIDGATIGGNTVISGNTVIGGNTDIKGGMYLKGGYSEWRYYDDVNNEAYYTCGKIYGKIVKTNDTSGYNYFEVEANSTMDLIAKYDINLRPGDGHSIQCWGTTRTPDGTVSVSDENYKNSIVPLNVEDSERFIYGLSPIKYKLNAGTSDRYHHGFGAQTLKSTMYEDWGVYVESKTTEDGEEKVQCGLRYEELIADLIATVQSQNKRIKYLEDKMN